MLEALLDGVVRLTEAASLQHFHLAAEHRVVEQVLAADGLAEPRIVDIEIRAHDLQEATVLGFDGRLVGQLVVAAVERVADTAELVAVLAALDLERLHPDGRVQKVRGHLLALAGHLGAEERR